MVSQADIEAVGDENDGNVHLIHRIRSCCSDVIFYTKLTEVLQPTELQIEDISGGCGSSFNAYIVSDAFEGKKRLERQQYVYGVLEEEMKDIHALTMKCKTPAEAAK